MKYVMRNELNITLLRKATVNFRGVLRLICYQRKLKRRIRCEPSQSMLHKKKHIFCTRSTRKKFKHVILSTAAWISRYYHAHLQPFELRNVVHYRTGFIT
jgi:hypothetical protein